MRYLLFAPNPATGHQMEGLDAHLRRVMRFGDTPDCYSTHADLLDVCEEAKVLLDRGLLPVIVDTLTEAMIYDAR